MGSSPRHHHHAMHAKQVAAVAFFIVCSIAAVLLNKALFKNFQFPPMLTTSVQFVVSLGIMLAIYVAGRLHKKLVVIESVSLDLTLALKVLPVSLTFIAMVTFNNWFLMSVGVGFYAVGKSLSIPCSVVLTFLILRETTAIKSVMACLLITSGVFLGSYGDAAITFVGLLMGGLSSVFTAGYQIAVKHGLRQFQGDQWQLGFYNALWCVAVLTPLGLVMGEGDQALAVLYPAATAPGLDWTLVMALLASGVVGFSIAQATYLSIHYTSALAHHVTGAFKSCLQSFLGFVIWREAQSLLGLSGLALTLLGSYGFLISRMPAPAPPPPPKPETIV